MQNKGSFANQTSHQMFLHSSEDNDSNKSYDPALLSNRQSELSQLKKKQDINVGLQYDHRAWNKLTKVKGRKSPTQSQYGQFQTSQAKFKTMKSEDALHSGLGADAGEMEKSKDQTQSMIDKVKLKQELEIQELQKKLQILSKNGQLGRYRRFKMSSEMSNTISGTMNS